MVGKMIITEYTDKKGNNPCGSEFCQIFRSGKTAKIALNHIKRKNDFSSYNIVKANIFKVGNIYDRQSYKLLNTKDVI